MPYQARVELEYWKEHTCNHCGTPYRYLRQRKDTAKGPTPEAAQHSLENHLVKVLRQESDMVPCPHCGRYPPEMIGEKRQTYFTRLYLAEAVGFSALLLTSLVLHQFLISLILTVLGAGFALLTARQLISRPNRDLEGNKQRARELQEKGRLTWTPARIRYPSEEPWLPPRQFRIRFLLLLAAGLFCLMLPGLAWFVRPLPSGGWWAMSLLGTTLFLVTARSLRSCAARLQACGYPSHVFPKEESNDK